MVTPEHWAESVHDRCRADGQAAKAADDAFRERLAVTSATREQRTFLAREARAREAARRNGLRGALSRLTALLLGSPGRTGRPSGSDESGADTIRGRVNCAGLGAPECAARRRAAVRSYLTLPDTSDKPIVDAVGAADFHEMLHLGIKVHRWNPVRGWSASRMLHSKVWLIDYLPGRGGLTYVGAANATQRSHLADNEAGILSTDADFARQVFERVFATDLERASRRESGDSFHVVRSSNFVVRGSRWLRRFLVELMWLI